MNLIVRWIIAIALLPCMVAVAIPWLMLVLFDGSRWTHDPAGLNEARWWIGIVVGAGGFGLSLWSSANFYRFGGDETPAPWDPPRAFIVRGPYRYVRNPMILGVFGILLAESLLAGSWLIFGWFVLFVIGNLVYIPWREERSLERRFGEAYREYKRTTPRWIPLLWSRGSGSG